MADPSATDSADAPEPALLVERDGHVVTLTLNRPAKRNAFNAELLCRLYDAYQEIDADPGVRAVVMTGAGGNFSGGADLDRLVGALMKGEPPETEWEQRVLDDYSILMKGFLKEYRLTKPLVGAIEGSCYAGGFEIMMSMDLRVVGENAQIALSEVKRGLFPMGGTTVRLTRQIAWTHAMELMLLGDPVSGARAAEIGLVGHAVPDGTALEKATELARALAANGPLAVKGIKESAYAADALPEAEAFAKEFEIGMVVMASRDAREGPRAFLEKRPANFTGE
jgi:enoyl-CoA hydratase